MQVKVYRESEETPLPQRMTEESAGFDIFYHNDIILQPYEKKVIKSGLFFDIPKGYRMDIRSRSGLAFKDSVESFNGVIDSDYVEELGVLLKNESSNTIQIPKAKAYCQVVFTKIPDIELIESKTPFGRKTERNGGFGSTDKR